MRQHFTNDAGDEYRSHTELLDALGRYTAGKTVHELLAHNDSAPTHRVLPLRVGTRAQLRVRGQGHNEQGVKASIDPGEPEV